MTKESFLKLTGITEAQFVGEQKIKGSLHLSSLTSIPEGFNPTVGGSLYLSGLTSIPEGFNPIVAGSLYLGSLTSIPKGFNPTVGGYLNLRSLKSIPEGFNPTVGGSLNLSSLTSIPEGFNPTVGGSLDLSSLTSIPEEFNPTVGDFLYLRDALDQSKIKVNKIPSDFVWSWQNGKYMMFDGILCEVKYKKGNVYKVVNVGQTNETYVVTDGNGKFAHGSTIKEAREDLMFKISDIDKSEFEGLDVNKKLPFEKCIELYRVITGACSLGVKNFVKSNNIKRKKYSVLEIAEITNDAYGSEELKKFFGIDKALK